MASPTGQRLQFHLPGAAANEPAAHWSHATASGSALNEPGGHSEHNAEPGLALNLPTGQLAHVDDSVVDVKPAAQGEHTEFPVPTEIVPGVQATQATCPDSDCALPASHGVHAVPEPADW